jgi:hypothetical protein
MSLRTQRWCAWCGPLALVLFFVGFGVIAGLIPPPSPNESAAEIIQRLSGNRFGMRLGLVITCLGAALLSPWVVAIWVQMKRIEGRHAPLAYVQLILGSMLPFGFIIPMMIWQALLYRPDTPPEIVRALNDLAWLFFVGAYSPGVIQAIAIGLAILNDERPAPVFPRWIGYFNFWMAALFVPGAAIVFFHDGPFAWNGLVSWWLLVGAFAVWILLMSWSILIHAIRNQVAEETDDSMIVTNARNA